MKPVSLAPSIHMSVYESQTRGGISGHLCLSKEKGPRPTPKDNTMSHTQSNRIFLVGRDSGCSLCQQSLSVRGARNFLMFDKPLDFNFFFFTLVASDFLLDSILIVRLPFLLLFPL